MTDYKFLSNAYGTYTKIVCIWVIKQNIDKFKEIDPVNITTTKKQLKSNKV